MATIVDVAEKAGVSVATVSRVVQNSNRVSDEKKQRVLEAIRELDYRIDPNSSITRLRKKTILLICGNIQDEFIDNVIGAATEYDYEIAVYYTAGHAVQFDAYLKKCIKNKVIAGAITFALSETSRESIRKISEQIPVVQCCDDMKLDNGFVVSSNDYEMARDAVLWLAERGYQRIAFLGLGKMECPFQYNADRLSGYHAAYQVLGRRPSDAWIRQCDYSAESVGRETEALLMLPEEDRPDAVFCVRDITAVQVVNHLTGKGIQIPRQMAVMGCGCAESADMCWLPLSNVSHSYYEIAVEAMSLMQKRINGKASAGRRTNIHHIIVERQTT